MDLNNVSTDDILKAVREQGLEVKSREEGINYLNHVLKAKFPSIYQVSTHYEGGIKVIDFGLPPSDRSIGVNFLNTYISFNKADRHKLAKFDSSFDGFMSIADRMVRYKNESRNFELTEYPSQQEFYAEYGAKIEKLLNGKGYMSDRFYDPSDEDPRGPLPESDNDSDADGRRQFAKPFLSKKNCFEKITEYYQRRKYEGKLSLHDCLGIMLTLFTYLSSSDKQRIVVSVGDRLQRKYGCENIQSFLNLYRETVPFDSPRGTYGINTFLYLYFNQLFPISVSLNPWRVHGGNFAITPMSVAVHDLEHYGISKQNLNSYLTIKLVWDYIIVNQDLLGQRAKELLYFLFMLVHEAIVEGKPNLGKAMRLASTVIFTDVWPVISQFTYYTPEKLGLNSIIFTFKSKDYKLNETAIRLGSDNFPEASGIPAFVRFGNSDGYHEWYDKVENYINELFMKMNKDVNQIVDMISKHINNSQIVLA